MEKKFHHRLEWLRGIEGSCAPGVVFEVRLHGLEVGRLVRENEEWVFRYSEAFRNQHRFLPIANFPDLNREYRSPRLFPFFVVRVPSLRQPAVQEFIRKRKLIKVDEATLLRQFGRRSVANPFELVPG